jgi:hypothetical protein
LQSFQRHFEQITPPIPLIAIVHPLHNYQFGSDGNCWALLSLNFRATPRIPHLFKTHKLQIQLPSNTKGSTTTSSCLQEYQFPTPNHCNKPPKKSMVRLIFLAALAACHNPPSLFANHTAKLDLGAGLYTREQDHPDPPWKPPKLFAAISLNTSTRWKDPSWANLARASKFTSRSAIGICSPETTPSVLPFSLGKRVTSVTRKQRVIPPWTGGIFWYFGNPSNKELADLPSKPSPPPAPSIDSPVADLSNKEITMMKLRSSGGKAAEMARELDEIRQMNKKNYQMQHQREKEVEKRQKDEEAAERGKIAQNNVPPNPLPTMEDTISNFSNKVHKTL